MGINEATIRHDVQPQGEQEAGLRAGSSLPILIVRFLFESVTVLTKGLAIASLCMRYSRVVCGYYM